MKYAHKITAMVIAVFLLTACTAVDRARMGSLRNILILTVNADRYIDCTDFPSAKPLIDRLTAREDFSMQKPLSAMDTYLKTQILTAQSSRIITNFDYTSLKVGTVPDGIEVLKPYIYTHHESGDAAAILADAPLIDAVVFVHVSFSLIKVSEEFGFGKAILGMKGSLYVTGRDNAEIAWLEEEAESIRSITFAQNGEIETAEMTLALTQGSLKIMQIFREKFTK